MSNIRPVIATLKKLAQMDPQDEAVEATVKELQEVSSQLGEQMREDKNSPAGTQSMKDDMDMIGEQIDKLHAAAIRPAANYARIVSILGGLKRAVLAAKRPQNAAVRPKVAAIVEKVAGIFSEVDTVEDLDRPLQEVERAVHSLYGQRGGELGQSANKVYCHGLAEKGHRSESTK
jgi:vacuolar-type H+-ATPase subunit I/STV1